MNFRYKQFFRKEVLCVYCSWQWALVIKSATSNGPYFQAHTNHYIFHDIDWACIVVVISKQIGGSKMGMNKKLIWNVFKNTFIFLISIRISIYYETNLILFYKYWLMFVFWRITNEVPNMYWFIHHLKLI